MLLPRFLMLVVSVLVFLLPAVNLYVLWRGIFSSGLFDSAYRISNLGICSDLTHRFTLSGFIPNYVMLRPAGLYFRSLYQLYQDYQHYQVKIHKGPYLSISVSHETLLDAF